MASSGASMNVSSVQLFLEVAEAGSLSKVAARRQTVQSHVSRQITEFEKQCGGRLFRRTGRGVELTELGDARRVAPAHLAAGHGADRAGAAIRVEPADRAPCALGVIPTAAHPLMTRRVRVAAGASIPA